MSEQAGVKTSPGRRDWRLRCCLIESDRGAIRICLGVGSGLFFELRGHKITDFCAALDEAVVRVGGDCGGQWAVRCYDHEFDLEVCRIQAHEGIIRISCGDPVESAWVFELRGQEIAEFSAVLNQAQAVVKYDLAKYGEVIEYADSVELWSPGKQPPRTFALYEEGEEGLPPLVIAWGLDFGECVKVVCSRGDVQVTFKSAQQAQQALSAHNNVYLVWPNVRDQQDRVTEPAWVLWRLFSNGWQLCRKLIRKK